MTRAALVYDPRMAEYRFGEAHPLRPERFTLAIELMRGWDLLGDGTAQARVSPPAPATDLDLLRVHSAPYIAAVKDERSTRLVDEGHGLGEGDTPRFPGMHDVSALIAGGTIHAVDSVVDGIAVHAFNPAGGLHHAHRDSAAGFCVYNDCAIAIARATANNPGLRVAYVDIDAHHGDGVQEAFVDRADVLTISVHESGRFLYPGTGASSDVGEGEGRGYAVNVPLPPYSSSVEYDLAFDRVVEPALRAYRPDMIVAQLGADAYRGDPLTHLAMTIAGHSRLVSRLVGIAAEVCNGRLAATGGGGYEAFSATPRMWASAMAVLLGVEPPSELPAEWVDLSRQSAVQHGAWPSDATNTFGEPPLPAPEMSPEDVTALAKQAIEQTRASAALLGCGA